MFFLIHLISLDRFPILCYDINRSAGFAVFPKGNRFTTKKIIKSSELLWLIEMIFVALEFVVCYLPQFTIEMSDISFKV